MEQPFQIRDIDARFAEFVCEQDGDGRGKLRAAAEMASAAVGYGHICLDLKEAFGPEGMDEVVETLKASRIVGEPGQYRPLVLDGANRLYLYRYWKYEKELAGNINDMLSNPPEINEELLREGIARLFGANDPHKADWQRIAAATAVRKRFCVISGGPGTGKTTTVVSILSLLLEQLEGQVARIALAAPTGKAAARLKESVSGMRSRLADRTTAAVRLPEDVSTVHRLLGGSSGASRFRHNKDNPLPYDIVVIDEASMVPLPLMAKLVDALPKGARLILLGDRDQLASVEAGAVLGDICDTGGSHGFSAGFADFIMRMTGEAADTISDTPELTLADSVVVLRRNYRFGDDSVIGMVSNAINRGDGVYALDVMKGDGAGVSIEDTPTAERLNPRLDPLVTEGFSTYLGKKTPEECLAAFDRFRVLCALRQGRYGVGEINDAIEECLASHGLIKPNQRWYKGRPVMVTVNDYSLKLFNGDIGIALDDPDSEGELAVYFQDGDSGVRKFSPSRLPDHETVYAMTIHKSQGSEFARILMVLPPVDNPGMTRELLYTGITRARDSVLIWCKEEQFLSATARRIYRRSGLRQALWGN